MNSLAVRSLQQMQAGVRGLTTTRLAAAQFNPSPAFKKLKETQLKYQTPDGTPVFLKGGMKDRLLYHTTIILCVVGVGMSVKFIYDQAVPKK